MADLDAFIRVVLLARRKGATIRTLARCYGVSKSTMGRYVQAFEMIEASHLGQDGESSPDNTAASPLRSVPDGTPKRDSA